ncbi:hypothetical protein EJ08DRAFT_485401 [Tothia fuscella]|uniref:Uncharacterized protein n=1 Tax=Tothia fuscella TaxID=1048955 RepID=A0A9P4TUI1_9PEZI|nr:hypothetical protein EJ08DRAFT_485401 [Tothia fuscella]
MLECSKVHDLFNGAIIHTSFVDILRLCAPNAPYTPMQLKEIFNLFIHTIFPALANPSGIYNGQHHLLRLLTHPAHTTANIISCACRRIQHPQRPTFFLRLPAHPAHTTVNSSVFYDHWRRRIP